MKIPAGMTEKDVISTIDRVAERYAHKFKFGFYTHEDIKQEAFMIGMDALDRYDEKRPLENFLAVHVKNRLKNFKRDNYYRKEEVDAHDAQTDKELKRMMRKETRKHLMQPIDIDSVRQEGETNMFFTVDMTENLSNKEIIRIIDRELGMSYRKDYLRMVDGVYVSKARRDEVKEEILRILKENGVEEGPFHQE